MIIGKSLTALGSGGLKPKICVTAQAGAALNLHYKDSSIILQSYQLGAEETQHTFTVNVSETAYVVEDVTNGASVEVLVDTVAQYSVEIEYGLWLYRNGDECEDVTGGWTNDGYTDNLEVLSGEKRSTSMYMTHGSANGYTLLGTNNKIDFSGFTKLSFEIISIAGSGSKGIRLSSQKGSFWNYQDFYKEDYTDNGVFSVSLSDLTSDYIIFYVFGGNTIEISKVWLE